jgi:hypothetical protein
LARSVFGRLSVSKVMIGVKVRSLAAKSSTRRRTLRLA